MFHADSVRTVNRESSLLLSKRSDGKSCDTYVAIGKLNLNVRSESTIFLLSRPKCTVQKEIVTYMFNSMLDSIVESWETISPIKNENRELNSRELGKVSSNIIPPKRKRSIGKSSRSRKSKVELFDVTQQDESIPLSWWTLPDERAIIRFRNGNTYEGDISMKVMHGDGTFKWGDGTIYTGKFKDNKINGRGLIQWKDDTWYEGEFVENLRHGNGLYVDSRNQCSYIGEWCSGTKHGKGVIYYCRTFNNSYDGQWVYNVRHGFGSREYCHSSGYEGQWDFYIREGKGFMVWPNHDFYRGEWKNGVMSGCGTYIWDNFYNNSMSHPNIIEYRGQWLTGQRHGSGLLKFGLGRGAYYSGEFRNNQKHGAGVLVTNNGLVLQKKQLFQDDNLSPLDRVDSDTSKDWNRETVSEPHRFDMCDDTVGFDYHIEEAIKNFDKQQNIRNALLNDFFENNQTMCGNTTFNEKSATENATSDLISFELKSLLRSVKCYESKLKIIYYNYSTILNSKDITFTPIMIRLYLWQIYYDCDIHKKGLTLVDIDNMLSRNPKWLARSPHDPFEPIMFWQFIHSVISVASRLYGKKQLPGPKPDTIIAEAFRTFMEEDILPGVHQHKGRLVNGYGQFMPLKSLYKLYSSLGEPHTLLTFLRAVRRSSHYEVYANSAVVKSFDDIPFRGRNVYLFSDEISFVLDTSYNETREISNDIDREELKLLNFGNLSGKSIISIFSSIFPEVSEGTNISNLSIEMTFLEFFEIFVACALKSVSMIDMERNKPNNDLRDDRNLIAPPRSPTGL